MSAYPPPYAARPRRLTGAVLAGGLSSRLGRDKTGLRPAEGSGPDLLTRSILLLREADLPVLVVGREHPDCDWVGDDRPGHGPAGGIATALRHSGGPCLILSCDLPFMNAPTLRRLLAAREARPAGTLGTAFFQPDTGQIEHLAAVYEYAFLELLEQKLEAGLLKIARLLPQERIHKVPYALEEALPFFNINYPADLLLVRRYLEALRTGENA